jgi:hypothetical protein
MSTPITRRGLGARSTAPSVPSAAEVTTVMPGRAAPARPAVA